MLLHEIIQKCEEGKDSILTEILYKYKKSLYTYFKSYYNCEPVLVVTDVYNACQYAFIAPSNEFNEAIENYLEDENMSDEDKHAEIETISFNSIMLKDF